MNIEICKKCVQIHSKNEINKKALVNNEIKEITFFDTYLFQGSKSDICWAYISTESPINYCSSFCRKSYKIGELPEDILKEIKGNFSMTYNGKKEIERVLQKLSPNKGCPYYIEHKLTDWNRK